MIVGFPGETEEHFEGLLDFIKEFKFDRLGAFSYSPEEGTASYNFDNQVDEEVKEKRKDKIMKAQQKICYRKNKLHIGEVMEGLIYGKQGKDYLFRSYWNAPDDIDGKIFVESTTPLKIGQKIKVKIKDAMVYDLIGVALDN
jgi:ribosomal protein S12 methylthiotransferase